MYFITTKRMLEVCFFQHTPTFIIEPLYFGALRKTAGYCLRGVNSNDCRYIYRRQSSSGVVFKAGMR